MLIVDQNMQRILRVSANATVGTVLVAGSDKVTSRKAMFDARLLNLYFMQYSNCVLQKIYNGSTTSTIVFGQDCGASLQQFSSNAVFTMDSAGNFYIADNFNHRVLYIPFGGTTGSVLAGVTAEAGSDNMHLYHPQDIAFNETEGVIYVGDSFNHRIMRYTVGSLDGTVVAGGNGPGNAAK